MISGGLKRFGAMCAIMLVILPIGMTPHRAAALEPVQDIVRLQGTPYYERIATMQNLRQRYEFRSVLDSATLPLPASPECDRKFGSTAKSRSINWGQKFCWSSEFWAQGITGSEEGRWRSAVGHRNVLIISWHSSKDSNGHETSRITIVDLDRQSFRHVTLVTPGSSGELSILKSHAGGLAWAGQYLYLANTDSMYVFNLNHFFRGGNDIYLVAGEKWEIQDTDDDVAQYNLSSVSSKWVGEQAELIVAQWGSGDTHIFHWSLNSDERFVSDQNWVAESIAHVRVTSVEYVQGVEMSGPLYILNSSHVQIDGESGFDAMFRVDARSRDESGRSMWQMPRWNGQDLYFDNQRGIIWSLTEGPNNREVPGAEDPKIHKQITTFVYSYSSAGIL